VDRSLLSPSSLLSAGRGRLGARLRLLLLVCGVAALALAGSWLGRGFGAPAPVDGEPVALMGAAPEQAPAAPSAMLSEAPAPVVAGAPTAALAQPVATQVVVATAAPAAAVPAPTQPPASTWRLLVEERFDKLSRRWPRVVERTWSTSYRDGRYLLQMHGRSSISYSVPLDAHDFQLRADVQIEQGQAGLFFLIGKPNDFYRFLIDTEGRYQLEWEQVGAARPLIAWTESGALLRGTQAVNQLEVRRAGDELTLYANGTLLTSYALPPGNRLEGRVGLALDAADGQREGRALFDNLFVHVPAIEIRG
jgi:hypothetical protein